jgi:hypothetical protein
MPKPPLRKVAWTASAALVLTALPVIGWQANWFGRGPENAPPEQGPPPSLDQAQRQFLWEVEHRGLLLGKHGFGPFSRAFSRRDADALAAFLADPFEGQAPQDPSPVRLETAYADLVREQDGSRPLDRAAFLAHLLEYRDLFVKAPKVKWNLKTFAPVDRAKMEGPWEGTGVLRLWGKGRRGPVEVTLQLRFRLRYPTPDNLARPGWLSACAITQSHVARSKTSDFLLREVAANRGVETAWLHDNETATRRFAQTGGVYLCDFNRDGYLDMLVTDVNGYALYQGGPDGKFTNVTTQVGLPTKPPAAGPLEITAAFVDLDGDGWEDLILGTRIFRNVEGKQFEDYTLRTNLRIPAGAPAVVVADYDRDGLMDLYVVRDGHGKANSWIEGKSGKVSGNTLWRNRGNWRFENVTHDAGAAGGFRSTFSAAWLDANNDGWPDLYVINEFGNGVLLVNNKDGTFREQLLTDGPCDFGSMGLVAGDIDNDGNIDLYLANMFSKAGARVISNVLPGSYDVKTMAAMRRFHTGSELHRNRGGLRFEQQGQALHVNDVGWAYGAVLVDLDNDGWLDLFATCGYMSLSRDNPDG